ncbi:MAG: SsrA-binding protein SmpB [Chloroflexota bacterium]
MSDRKVIASNRKAYHDYALEEPVEAGLVLMGSEIKSIRDNRVNLKDGFVAERDGELWLMNVHISPFDQAGVFGHEPLRPRKLLLHQREIGRLISQMRERGYSLIPTLLYLKKGRAKVEIALGKGKKQYDKRASLAEKDSKREIARALKERAND